MSLPQFDYSFESLRKEKENPVQPLAPIDPNPPEDPYYDHADGSDVIPTPKQFVGWDETPKEIAAASMREFSTGATRDTDAGKLDYRGFLSARAIKVFAEYMHSHRRQANGSVRAADNWKLGIPVSVYVESLSRHMVEFWIAIEEGDYEKADAISPAIWFNIQGYIHERSKSREDQNRKTTLGQAGSPRTVG